MSADFEFLEAHREVSFKWKIKEFFSLPKGRGYYKESPTFLLSDAKWCIQIYPNGDLGYDSVGYVSMYLYLKCSSSEKYRVAIECSIRKADDSALFLRDHEFEFAMNRGLRKRGWFKFIQMSKLSDLKDILTPDGYLRIVFTARIFTNRLLDDSVETSYHDASSSKSNKILQENFNDLFLSGRHGDVTIKVKEQEFQAHRLILVARSPVFSAMFDHDTEEKKTGIVNITDCDPGPFKDFLSFIYTGKVDMVSSSNAIALFKIGDKYDLKDLKVECVRCMAEEMSAETFCDIFLLATMHSELKLLETSTDFFVKNVKAILPTSMWQSFIDEHSTMANELFIHLVNKKL